MKAALTSVFFLGLAALPCFAAEQVSRAIKPKASDNPPTNGRFVYHAIADVVAHTKVADMDGDGHKDVVLHFHRDDRNIKQSGRRLGLGYLRWPDFRPVMIFDGDVTGDRFVVVDVNGDGRNDIVSAKILPDKAQAVFWYENPGQKPPGLSVVWREHPIGSIPKGEIKDVLAADVNRDGQVDVAVRSVQSTALFFQQGEIWRAKRLTHAKREGLALVDLDLDGDLDVVLNGFWFETPADPLNGEYVEHEIDRKWYTQNTGQWPDNAAYVGSADFNRDGLPDIVFAHSEKVGYPLSYYSVDNLAQVRTGPWKEHIIAEVFDWCETVDIGDIDNDGSLDVIAAKFQRHDPPGGKWENFPPFPVSVFYNVANNGTRWLRQDVAMDGVYAAALGDVGSDGDLDIVGPQSYWKGPIRLWENQTADTKWALDRWTYIEVDNNRGAYTDFEIAPPKIRMRVRYFGLAMADLTGDGMKDIVSGRYFYRNPGGDLTAKWERADFGVNVDGCLITDVDGDEFGDVIAMALPDIYWLEAKDRQGASWTARKIGTAPRTGHGNSQGFALGQIVPGGKPEVVIATEDGAYYFEIPAQPEGDWRRHLITKEVSDEGVDLADIDRDGWLDFVAGKNAEHVAWWRNPGLAGVEWKRHPVGTTSPHPTDRVKVRDLNGDGRPDIVVTEERWPGKEPDANLYWFEQPSNPYAKSWVRHRVFTGYSLNNLDVADFDRDGDLDIVTSEHKGDLRLLLFENDGRGNFIQHVLDHGKESHLGSQAIDLDGDGDLDVVSIGWDNHKILHVWRNDAVKR